MKTLSLSVAVALSLSISGSASAFHTPNIIVKVEGNASQAVSPKLVFNPTSTTLGMFDYEGSYYAEDVVAGSYTFSLTDKESGATVLVEEMVLKPKGKHHLSGTERTIDCNLVEAAIQCAVRL